MIVVVWGEIVTEWGEHRDESMASVCQGESTQFVEDVLPVGDGGEKPINVVLADTLREESDDAEEIAGAGAKFAERW